MAKCLYCYKELNDGELDFHKSCSKKIFGTTIVPDLSYTRDNLNDLAKQLIRSQTTLTGVQAKLSLDINKGTKSEGVRFTISTCLCGDTRYYILFKHKHIKQIKYTFPI